MSNFKKHILRKKLHLSRKEFRDLENLIEMLKAIIVPIIVTKILKKILLEPKHPHKHFHHHFEECDCGCHEHHHHKHCCTPQRNLRELIIKYFPTIISAIEKYKLNNSNNIVVNSILDIMKEIKK